MKVRKWRKYQWIEMMEWNGRVLFVAYYIIESLHPQTKNEKNISSKIKSTNL